MTAACREACCSVTARLTVGDLFERGFRRNRAAPLSIDLYKALAGNMPDQVITL